MRISKDQMNTILYSLFILLFFIVIGIKLLVLKNISFGDANWNYHYTELYYYYLKNPYIFSSVNSFSYPPIILLFFGVVYGIGLKSFGFYVIYGVINLIASLIVISKIKKEYLLYLVAVGLTSFGGAYYALQTGNLILLLHLIWISSFYYFKNNKWKLGCFLLGVIVSFQLHLGLFISGIWVLKMSTKEKINNFLWAIFGIGSVFLISFLGYPRLFISYLKSLMGKLPIKDAIEELGGIINPNLFNFIYPKTSFVEVVKLNFVPITYSVVCLSIMIIVISILKKLRHHLNNVLLLSLTYLPLFIILPRFKPYTFILLVVPIYLLTKKMPLRNQIIILLLSSCVFFTVLIHQILEYLNLVNMIKDTFLYKTVFVYEQLISLILVTIYINLYYYTNLTSTLLKKTVIGTHFKDPNLREKKYRSSR